MALGALLAASGVAGFLVTSFLKDGDYWLTRDGKLAPSTGNVLIGFIDWAGGLALLVGVVMLIGGAGGLVRAMLR
jgi:hypothetical protein